MPRQAIAASDVVSRLVNTAGLNGDGSIKAPSNAKKQASINAAMQGDVTAGLRKIGQAMVGPILLKLKYEGIARFVLVEDPLTEGAEFVYDVLDDLGKAYSLNDNEGEIKVTPFEGKRVRYEVFRIAAQPAVKKEDTYRLRVNTVEYAQDEARQAIQKKEDSYLLKLLQAALVNYAADPNHTITPDHDLEATFSPGAISTLAGILEMHELDPTNIVANPMDVRTMQQWEIKDVGWKFKDEIVDGLRVTQFMGFNIQRSVLQPQGKAFMFPEAKYLGMMPVMYSLDMAENPQPAEFKYAWVLDEVLSMVILNPRGIGTITAPSA